MSRPRPLIVMGSKRSGTTLFASLLNSHPNVFVSHESDIVWILYQLRDGWPERFEVHPLDVPESMTSTLKSCSDLLDVYRTRTPTREQLVDLFYDVQMRLVNKLPAKGNPRLLRGRVGKRIFIRAMSSSWLRRAWTWSLPYTTSIRQRSFGSDLAWLGDKKHLQHVDPEIRPFIAELLPDARYIHLVRHPRGVMGSFENAVENWDYVPPYWRAPRADVLDAWAQHEEWCLAAKDEAPGRVLTVRMEDICGDPVAAMTRVCGFLDLELPEHVADVYRNWGLKKDPNAKHADLELPDVPRARRIMDLYEYEHDVAA